MYIEKRVLIRIFEKVLSLGLWYKGHCVINGQGEDTEIAKVSLISGPNW